MHVVALAVPGVAAPGEAVLGEGVVNVAALGNGERVGVRRPVRAAGRGERAVGVDGRLHVLVRVDIDRGALRMLAGTPRIAADVVDRELFVAVVDLLEDRLVDRGERSVDL